MAGRRRKKGQTARVSPLPHAVNGRRVSKEAIYRILPRVAAGETLLKCCQDEGINYQGAWDQLTSKYSTEYARAKECGTLALIEKAQIRADGSTSETAAGDRVAVDYVKWLAERRNPRDYAVKTKTEISGPENLPLSVAVTYINPAVVDAEPSQKEIEHAE